MDVTELFNQFKKSKIAVIGDVMIDAYLEGSVNRVSPEAPVPIVNVLAREERLGGAANVALNLLSLGSDVAICSVVGKDDAGEKILELMGNHQMSLDGMVQSEDRMTTVKTRVIGNNQHLLRVDQEITASITTKEELALIEGVKKIIAQGCDAIIFEDYNKGVLTKSVITSIIKLANEAGVITTVDPKRKNFLTYKNVTLFKPNLKELKEGVKRDFDIQHKADFEAAVELLEKEITPDNIFVTLSEHGVFIKNKTEKHYIPAHIRSIADVSGAGDTVISVATLCMVAEIGIKATAEIANLAGGLVCEKVGVVAIDAQQLEDEVAKIEL